ncbi:HEAT repeat domain-containing protein [Rivularia sp. UHCC 0363]|uniref:HEAT repeat domain-containing protein n=1 Tax=Rivularia sp. UHCC 0363 TaxID=3110244 RepID=UPI002B208B7E|nr:HEAT repeat domain-containing protein [Rivularia sp. UHCC 0363]MEA5598193.1 HEAT repeat domain-containing protein [Rivularia sp. UHCC 0363]
MKHHIIANSLLFLTLTACNLDKIKDSNVQRLTAEKNVKELIDNYIRQPPTFGTDQAAEALGNLGDKQAVDPLITVLNTPVNPSASSPETKTHVAAAIALGKLKDTRAIKPLVANVKHPNIAIPSVSFA